MGFYLLDALVEAASARGVPFLDADVMSENRKMGALVRERGFCVLDHPYPGVTRVAMAAAQPLDAPPRAA